MLYKEWLNEWLELYVKAATKERTYRKYRQQAEKYLLPALGNYDVNALSAVELQKFLVSLSEHGLAPNSVNFIIAVLRSSLKKGVQLGIIDRQYGDAIVRPRVRANAVSCFTKEEQKKIENYILSHDKPYLFGILLALYTGLRIGELLALTWEDVDLQKGTMSITKSCYDKWEDDHYLKAVDTTKTKSSERTIPIPRQIIVHMKALKKQTNSRYVVIGKTEWGAQVRSYQRAFERLLKKLNIKHKGFHALRHTFATRALEVGVDVKTLSEILGHQDPSITLRRYTHSLMDHKTEMMNKVGQLLR